MFGVHRRARPPRSADPDLRFLRTSLWVTVVVAAVTALGGLASHSVAVPADAGEEGDDILSSTAADVAGSDLTATASRRPHRSGRGQSRFARHLHRAMRAQELRP